MKTFKKFREDALTEGRSRKQSVYEAEEECPHCGESYPEGDPHHCWQSGHHNEPDVSEDEGAATGGPLPTNSAGSANIAGIGIQRKGEPSFAEPGVPVRRKLEIVGPDPVDPRMFADKIFGHSKLADIIHKTGVK